MEKEEFEQAENFWKEYDKKAERWYRIHRNCFYVHLTLMRMK